MFASGCNETPPAPTSDSGEAPHAHAPLPTGPQPASSPRPTPVSHKARILVVEDNPFVSEGLIRLINRQPDLLCCGRTSSIAATEVAVAIQRPDLTLLDLKLTDGEAWGLIGSLSAQFPEMLILVLSQSDERLFAEKALHAGARGYVMKQEAGEILAAIRAVLLGRVYVSRDMAGRLPQKLFHISSASRIHAVEEEITESTEVRRQAGIMFLREPFPSSNPDGPERCA